MNNRIETIETPKKGVKYGIVNNENTRATSLTLWFAPLYLISKNFRKASKLSIIIGKKKIFSIRL